MGSDKFKFGNPSILDIFTPFTSRYGIVVCYPLLDNMYTQSELMDHSISLASTTNRWTRKISIMASLKRLMAVDIIEKIEIDGQMKYKLTQKGNNLRPVFDSIAKWGYAWS